MRHLRLTFLIGFLLVTFMSYGQREVQRDNFIWLTYSLTKPLNNNLNLSWMAQSRRFAFPDRQHQFLTGIKLTKKFDSGVVLGGGFTYFLQALPGNRNDVDVVRPELRPHQEVSIGNKIGKWLLGHRLMIEERWFRETEGDQLVDGYFFQIRWRYRFMLQRPFVEGGKLNAVLSNEVMLNSADPEVRNVFDQNRLYFGVKHKVSDRISIDAGYIYWYQQFPQVNQFASFHIINLAVSHTLK